MPSVQFKGKSFVQNHHLAVPYHQLVPSKENSLNPAPSLNDNLIVHGDNLLALKVLLPTYAGKVKCIYIDPPYNTGNEGWVYNDNVKSPVIKEWIGKTVGREGEDFTRHDKWLCMMMPRLKLLRELLRDDGLILVSIDDIEQHRLRMLLDEVFGEENFITQFLWRRRQTTDSRNQNRVSSDHEYVLAYARDNSKLEFRGTEIDVTKYKNPDNDPRGDWASIDLSGLATREQRPNLHYDIVDPATGNVFAPNPKRGWSKSKAVVQQMIDEGRILFPKSPTGRPREKKFLNALQQTVTGFSSWLESADVGFNTDGTRDLSDIFDERIFDFPKPTKLLTTLFAQVTEGDDIILDSFAGSGTTAQAVLELNKEDGGNRKFILVEMEDYADRITAERVRRVINGVSSSKNEHVKAGLGGSYSFFDLGDAIETSSLLSGSKLPSYKELARYVYYTATGEDLDEAQIDETRNYVGRSSHYEVYVLYRPDIEYLKTTALTLDMARELRQQNGDKQLLIFAPTKYIEQTELDNLKITFCQLPFEIYKVA